MVARVRAMLRVRRIQGQRTALACDDLVLDTSTSRVTARGSTLALRGIEYRLLGFFMSYAGRTFNRN